MVKLLIVALAFLTLLVPASAQETHRVPIAFTCTCDDAVGRTFAVAFRDLLAASPRYREPATTNNKTYTFQVKVISMDPSENHEGKSTIFSTVFLLGDTRFLTHSVQICGRSRVVACASDTLATLDSYLN